MNQKRIVIGVGVVAAALLAIFFLWTFTFGLDKSAGHINYTPQKIYGKGNYVYDTVTFSGSGMGSESVLSVKKIEALAYDRSLGLGYQNEYSLLTSGSVFTTKKFTGIKLYLLLQYLGMDKGVDKDTNVTIISKDGYTVVLTIGELLDGGFGSYLSKTSTKPKERHLPVLLSFGCDGVPLVGPTEGEAIDKRITEKDGFRKGADNIGGPIRLTVGQRASTEFNAPDNAKWVSKVIVGKNTSTTRHTGSAADTRALSITLHKASAQKADAQTTYYSFRDIENFAMANSTNATQNYYGEKSYFDGTDLWQFLRHKAGVLAGNGSVAFTFKNGDSETVSLEYLRNISGNYQNYKTTKDGLTITGVKPAIGYAVNGKATSHQKLYALLPAKGTAKTTTTVQELKSIDVFYGNDRTDKPNPYVNTNLMIKGEGMAGNAIVSVGYLEDQIDLMETLGNYTGTSLLALLQNLGLAVDASGITVSNGTRETVLSIAELESSENKEILATRIQNEPLDKGHGPIALRGKQSLDHVTSVTVHIKPGRWKHTGSLYQGYLDSTITITGTSAKFKRTYTLAQLEALGPAYTTKEHFAAGGGGGAYQGVILRELILDNLKPGEEKPDKIVVIGKDGYMAQLSVSDVMNGVESHYQPGENRDIILAYSLNGTPLVPALDSIGYTGSNAFGPLRLIVENQTAKWIKTVSEIQLGNETP